MEIPEIKKTRKHFLAMSLPQSDFAEVICCQLGIKPLLQYIYTLLIVRAFLDVKLKTLSK